MKKTILSLCLAALPFTSTFAEDDEVNFHLSPVDFALGVPYMSLNYLFTYANEQHIPYIQLVCIDANDEGHHFSYRFSGASAENGTLYEINDEGLHMEFLGFQDNPSENHDIISVEKYQKMLDWAVELGMEKQAECPNPN